MTLLEAVFVATLCFFALTCVLLMTNILVRRRRAPLPELSSADLQNDRLKFEFAGTKMVYQKWGHGPPMVLIHGIGAARHVWRKIIPTLAQTYTVYGMDLPGFGQSSKHELAPYTLKDQVGFLKKWIDQLNLENVTLVGSSMGGSLALALHQNYVTGHQNGVVDTVVLIAPHVNPNRPGLKSARFFKRQLWLAKIFGVLPMRILIFYVNRRWEPMDVVKLYVKFWGDPISSHISFWKTTEGTLASPDVAPRNIPNCASIKILYGMKDRLVRYQEMQRLHEHLQNSTFETHPLASHQPMEDQPKWVVDAILSFTPKA